MASPPVKFDVLDHRAVRRELENEAKTAAEDLGLKVSYAEDNAHLCLSFLMCAPFRSHTARTMKQLRFVSQEYFLVLLASPEKGLPKVRLMFKMKRLDDKFSLVISGKDESLTSDQVSVTQFVHEDGYVAKEKYHKWIKDQITLYKSTKTKSL